MGIAGRIASGFLRSRLTPLVTLAALIVGGIALLATPREEEPQISVPMIDVLAALPGASPAEVENLLTRPIERMMWEIPGVEYVYSMAGESTTLVTVRFKVGANQEQSVVKVHAKLMAAMDQAPPGASAPLVRPYAIDDVPILTFTLHGGGYGSNMLREMAIHLEDEIRTIPDVSRTFVVGGAPRQFEVLLDPARLAASGVTPGEVVAALHGANRRLPAGEVRSADQAIRVEVGAPLSNPAELSGVVVASRGGRPVYLGSVAEVREGYGEPVSYVTHRQGEEAPEQAVTIAVAKRRGANAATVALAVEERLEAGRQRLLPASVALAVTRNYGETATEKANELIFHLLLATLSVTALIGIVLGWREALVVLVAVPVTLALTLFVYYALGYSLNRITLFALIFSIGILVDDAIVVVENIYRHLKLARRPPEEAAVEGVDEVGNPTILATFTVIAAILPMAFVSGLMGPYMRPIPIGASAAMLASLGVAFVITPWLALRLLRGHVGKGSAPGAPAGPEERTGFGRWYGRVMSPLLTGDAEALPDLRRYRDAAPCVGRTPRGPRGAGQDAALRQQERVSGDSRPAGRCGAGNRQCRRFRYLRRGSARCPKCGASRPTRGPPRRSTSMGWCATISCGRAGTSRTFRSTSCPRESGGARATTSRSRRGPASTRSRAATAPGPRSPRFRPAHRCFPPWWPRSMARMTAYGSRRRVRVMAVFEATPGVVDVDWTIESPQAKWRLSGRSGAGCGSRGKCGADRPDRRSGDERPEAGLATSPTAREPSRSSPRLPPERRSSLGAVLGIPVATALGPAPLARFVTVDSSRAAGLAASEESASGDLRDRGRRGDHRVSGLCHSGDEPRARYRAGRWCPDRALQRDPAGPARRNRAQVGRGVADHHRSVPRPRSGIRALCCSSSMSWWSDGSSPSRPRS